MKAKNRHKIPPKIFSLAQICPIFKKKPLSYSCSSLEQFLGLAWFHRRVEVLRQQYANNLADALSEIFPYLNVEHSVSMDKENPIVKPGGKIIVANHDSFLLDGFFLIWFVKQYRNDFRFIAISELSKVSVFLNTCFFLDNRLNTKKNAGRNVEVYQEVINWLKAGKIVIFFPQADQEKKKNWRWEKKIPWSNLPYSLSKIARVPIVPIKLDMPKPYLFRILTCGALFFYNVKMPIITRFFQALCVVFCFKQVKYSVGKKISCVVGSQLMSNTNETRGNFLRDYTYQL